MNTLRSTNAFLMQADEERRLAHRQEIKRAIAGMQVKRARIEELRSIVAKLNADSEAAAETHSVDATRLQSELDRLDEQQIEAVMAGKATPAKSLQRRGEILTELSSLNTALELRCEANRRSIHPLEKQIRELQAETSTSESLKNRLTDLCSVDLRRRRMFCEMRLQFCNVMLKESQRLVAVHSHNTKALEANGNGEKQRITSARQSDAEAVSRMVSTELQELHQESARLQAEATAE